MGVRRGGQEGALAPPWPAKIACFSTFLKENSMFLPLPRKFCPPLEKSLRTPMPCQDNLPSKFGCIGD